MPNIENMPDIVDSLFCGLFGSCVLQEDEKLVMKVLKRYQRIFKHYHNLNSRLMYQCVCVTKIS